MEIKEKQTEKDDASLHKITPEEFEEFTQAQSYEAQLKILLAHAEKNKKRIAIKRAKQEVRIKTQEEIKKVGGLDIQHTDVIGKE